jgi:hypothetical protein
MGRAVGWLAAVAVAIAACAMGPAWVFPSPAPLPAGAVAVSLRVTPIPNETSDVEFACPGALLLPVEMVVDRSVSPPTVAFRFVDSGEPANIEWSWGISAYEVDGKVHIVAPDGDDLMVEGVVADDLGGGGGDETFNVCDVRSLPQQT